MSQVKNEYRNDSPGNVGVIQIENGKEKGIPVKPGDTCWLSEEERIATANAPKHDENNPLANGDLVLVTPAAEIRNRRPIGDDTLPADPVEAEKAASPEDAPAPPPPEDPEATQKAKAEESEAQSPAQQKAAQEQKRRAQAAKQADQPGKPVDETGAAVPPQGLPHQGKRAAGEEVATPAAPAKAGATKG